MIKLFLDIETLPGDDSIRHQLESEVKPPGSMKRADTIEKWEREERTAEVEKRYRATSLRGHTGRILCIGYIKDGPESSEQGVIEGDEPAILRAFWELAADVDVFVGFNILDFDLTYIWQRSVVHRIYPSQPISFARYRNDQVYDVMEEWGKWGRDRISLDALARALGIQSPKGNLDGSKVYGYYLEGRLQEIYDYCLADVIATREAYNRLNFV